MKNLNGFLILKLGRKYTSNIKSSNYYYSNFNGGALRNCDILKYTSLEKITGFLAKSPTFLLFILNVA